MTPTCPKCRSAALSLYAMTVVEWDGSRWEMTHEFGRRWLCCSDCGHSWDTRRPLHALVTALTVTP